MADGEFSAERPIIFGRLASSRAIPSRRGGPGSVQFHNRGERIRRIDARFADAADAFGEQVQLSESIHAADPQLVLVFEALDEQVDLSGVAARLGIEVLIEAEGGIEPTDEFQLGSENPRKPYITSCLHAVCTDQSSFDELLRLWRAWKSTADLPQGYAALRDLFTHLKDVRPWGPQDRLASIDWTQYFEGRIDDRAHSVEIELWYRRSPAARAESQLEITRLIEQAGGSVTSSVAIDQIGYHGLKCLVPTEALMDLASGSYDSVSLVRSTHVMYLRVGGQSLPVVGPSAEPRIEDELDSIPSGSPVLCLFDGVPATNHPLLRDRVEVYDPDGFADRATVEELRHGTWMTSVAVWGDRGTRNAAATRPVLVRPVLTPADDTIDRTEELPFEALIPDLMWRAFRELFDGTEDEPAAAPSIAIVNISLGDPAAPFDTILSSWARMIDWLSYEYGVLVVVSAGNHSRLRLSPSSSAEITRASGDTRRRATLEAIHRQQSHRRLLAPAESINAIAVGAVHADESTAAAHGYAVDPTDGLPAVSPISPTGSGYRRSIKPDLVANGGRVFFREGITPQDNIEFAGITSIGPGIRVATPTQFNETHVSGTSPAAALISRQAARLHDVVEEISAGTVVSRRQRAAAIKALLVHGTAPPEPSEHDPLGGAVSFGNGALARDLSEGCAANEAVVLYIGSIGANEEQELLFPLPNGLSVREVKRIKSTLAWLTPVNWRHRQYRKASLTLVKPAGAIPKLDKSTGISSDESTRGASTVQHQTWEFEKAFASGQGSNMSVRLKCYEQAGGLLGERVDFAVALSLWVAPSLGVDVYSQVKAQVEARVAVRPHVQQ